MDQPEALGKDEQSDWVLVDIADRVATVTLNRPHRLNAMPPEMRRDLMDRLRGLDDDPDVRAVVLTGAGDGFCAGSDRGKLQGYTPDAVAQRFRQGQHSSSAIRNLSKPVVAAVNGSVAGLGFAIAAMTDVRFSVPHAKWTTSFARLGLSAEAGLSQILPQLVGIGWANDLLLSARVLDGTEAHRIGLVQYLSEPAALVPDAQAYARRLAENSPWSLSTMRRQLREDPNRPLDQVMESMEQLVVESIGGPDFAEAQRAMAERREPRFT